MKIAFGCDHGGFALKEEVIALLGEMGHEVMDQGAHSAVSVDFPDYAVPVCDLVLAGVCERGILICGTGIGMSMVANRYPAIRAALCHEIFTARMSREHNNANILCLGARVIGPGLALEIVRNFIDTGFAGGRHLVRLEKFSTC